MIQDLKPELTSCIALTGADEILGCTGTASWSLTNKNLVNIYVNTVNRKGKFQYAHAADQSETAPLPRPVFISFRITEPSSFFSSARRVSSLLVTWSKSRSVISVQLHSQELVLFVRTEGNQPGTYSSAEAFSFSMVTLFSTLTSFSVLGKVLDSFKIPVYHWYNLGCINDFERVF